MDQVQIEPLNDDFSPLFPLAYYADVLDCHSQMVVMTLWIGCLLLNENWPFYSLRLVPACLITSIAYVISFLIKKLDLRQYQNMRISSGVLIVGISLLLTWEPIAELVTDLCFYILDDEPASNAENESLSQQEEILEEQQLPRAEGRSNAEEATAYFEETIQLQQTQQGHQAEIFASTFAAQSTAVSEETIQFSESPQVQREWVHTSTFAKQGDSTIIKKTLTVDQSMASTGSKIRSRKHRSGTNSKTVQCDSPTIHLPSSSMKQDMSISNVSSLNLDTLYAERGASHGELNTSLLKQQTSSMQKQQKSPVVEEIIREVQNLEAESTEQPTLESPIKPLKKVPE
ncbi:uncharacterized protein LOC109541194 [Dendroctonus ponderosae]|uniref:uncharacterized protein LOC109541194 n=1 Tax=Dendroctonus ponderosae TaxID=77166 RepID=UPI002034A83E|nr:uncharacterized protein LOC109541194 [Dendroctonus ponderosae]KAH1029993.1 hypothetical protein HUJ05_003133 [Dendroctonus ponderosae]